MPKYSPDDRGFLTRAECPPLHISLCMGTPDYRQYRQALRQLAEKKYERKARVARERAADDFRRVFEFLSARAARKAKPEAKLNASLPAAEALRIFPDATCYCSEDRHAAKYSGLCTDLRQHLGIDYRCAKEWEDMALPQYMAQQLDKDLETVKDTRKHYAIITNYMALNETRMNMPKKPTELVHWPPTSALAGKVTLRRLRKFLRQCASPPMQFQKPAETSYFVTHMLALQHLRSVAPTHGLTILSEDPRWSANHLYLSRWNMR